jgi:double-stranded uracil-DNA glycosylase
MSIFSVRKHKRAGRGDMYVTHLINPVWNNSSTILILGTMPSPQSRAAGFYYMHPQNRFWPVIAAISGKTLHYTNSGTQNTFDGETNTAIHPDITAAVIERRVLVLQQGIALWDVLAGCDIDGAEDASIRNPVPNNFTEIISSAHIRRIYTTGQTAYRYYIKLCEEKTGIPAVCLPSTSPANRGRWPLDKLITVYQEIYQ